MKLLRVLREREFQRVGDVQVRRFTGKLVAATNRDLALEMERGAFREDFYYRLCADQISTPSLYDQLCESPEGLVNFVRFIAGQLLVGMEDQAEILTTRVVAWIQDHLGPDYPWPGNIRELEQCVANIMIRGQYSPASRIDREKAERQSWVERFLADVEAGRLSIEELTDSYCRLALAKCGGFQAAAKRLGVDRRTVQRHCKREAERGLDSHASTNAS